MAEPHGATPLNHAWLQHHPLPAHDAGTDKNSRGHVVAIGGSRQVPGGLLLTGEAALRAGAGKVQLATIASSATGAGIALPEAGVLALGETLAGAIDADELGALAGNLKRCDSVVVGPAMVDADAARRVLDTLLAGLVERQTLLLDGVVLHTAAEREPALRGYSGTLLMTPNPDEVASLLGREPADTDDLAACAREIAQRFQAVAVCKGGETVIATPTGDLLHYPGGGPGLATGGSGDVLAGIVGGLLARGAEALVAAAWGVWLHGEAGRRLADEIGPIGFLARELPPLVPALMRTTS